MSTRDALRSSWRQHGQRVDQWLCPLFVSSSFFYVRVFPLLHGTCILVTPVHCHECISVVGFLICLLSLPLLLKELFDPQVMEQREIEEEEAMREMVRLQATLLEEQVRVSLK